MNILGLTITRTKALPPAPLQPLSGSGGWGIVREPFIGAWQSNLEIRTDNYLTSPPVFSCTTLISGDVGKCCLRLVQKDTNGIWTETDSPTYSPVLRKPNHYQTAQKFIEQWVVSKLTRGNTYVLIERNMSRKVAKLYVLDPTRVVPLVAQDGSVWYELRRDDLSGLPLEQRTVPSSEIIHDTMIPLFHPLVGVSPIYAAATAALQGLKIQDNSYQLFNNGSNPGGVLTAPGAITKETADRLKAYWDANYTGSKVGKVAVLGDGLKYEPMSVTAVDAQLIEQLKWSAETVCSVFHVPAYMIGIGSPPPYANIEPLIQQYFAQCLQTLMLSIETKLDEGLGLTEKIEGRQLGTEFDISDLIWMDTKSKTDAAVSAVGGSILTIDDARKRYFGLGPVTGGSTIWMQQQDTSVEALMDRDRRQLEAAKEQPPAAPVPPSQDDEDEDAEDLQAASLRLVRRKALELRRRHAA